MKKVILFLACTLITSGAIAQKKIVDEVNKDVSGFTPDFKAARDKLKPALTNAETKDDARTWFVAGKTEFGFYDNLLGKKQIGQQVDDAAMSKALLDGYEYFMKALPLDSIAETEKDGSFKLDKKGNKKYKTKYSKEIANLVAGHVNDFSNVASVFYENKDFGNAGKAWDIYASFPDAAFLGKSAPEIPDTIIGQVRFFQGIAAWQNEDNASAVKAFEQARKKGYTKKEAYDYAMSCYAGLNDNDGIIAIAKEAYPLYGKEDNQYISILINDLINKSKYEEANQMLDEAIAANPQNAEFYNVKGTLYENQKEPEKAFEFYKKAIEIKPDYAKGQFDVGRYYFNKAVQKRDEINKLSGAAYQKAVANELNPLYKEALPYLEKAYQLDPENNDAKNALRNIYYFLGDEAKLNELERGY